MNKAKKIPIQQLRLIVYDFDGVMTDNRVLTMEDGREGVWVSRADGLGIELIKNKGIPQIILSTETNKVVKARAKKVGLPILMGVKDKRATLTQYCQKKRLPLSSILYIGNDVNDLEAMKLVGFPIAPADAHPTICKMANKVLQTRGGEGVIRELADLLN
ncbi:KdsC family phosphatase [Candidatus Nitronereus thalassa]|uniref:HAD hydrolase family protein n=1 Tax=Candidatus Nitronereus thalassa TaxID=3020898 RepID=A0ABU3K5C4_9BACT|nr:HAD hydrolase family protein [Candidatus Nitronereus thalassa]MDT7041543.1 HAD hydrolase family protein [Candidatus Nitronereus thalassa]